MRLLMVLVCASACGRVGFDELGRGGGGSGDGGGNGDGNGDGLGVVVGTFAPTTDVFIKESNTDARDFFGTSVSITADGNTMVIGAPGESSTSTGVDGNQATNTAPNSGAAYVFVRTAGTWMQQSYLKASNTDAQDNFGRAVAISSDGSTIAIGADTEASNASGIDGDQTDNSGGAVGAVYVFARTGSSWTQQVYIKPSNPQITSRFGHVLAIAADGNTLAVGSYGEASNATGINGNQANTADTSAGAAYVFARTGTTWTQQAYVKSTNTDVGDDFGYAIALSGDGSTLLVGAFGEDSGASGVGGDETSNSASQCGAAYVYTRSGTTWTPNAYLKPSQSRSPDEFGISVAVSGDGSTLAVGAIGESSNATGVDGNQADASSTSSGSVYLFARSGGTWAQQAYVKASNTDAMDWFGEAVALSDDGNALIVGASVEASDATGIGGDPTDNSAAVAGAAYAFARTAAAWSQTAYLKASFTRAGDGLGGAAAIAANATTVVVGASGQQSDATGVGGNASDASDVGAGAAFVFR